MPFDPTKPANGSPITSAELRVQLNALNDDIQTRATQAALDAGIGTTSSNSNAVATLGTTADSSYNQGQLQLVLDKLDELINALRR